MTLRLLTLFCCLSFTLMTSAQMSGGQIRRPSPHFSQNNQATKKKPVSSNSNYIKIKNGWGVENVTFENGVAYKYEGEFKDGKYNGKGTMTFADGRVYKGEFKDGEWNGRGIQYNADGTKWYDGEFKDGKYNGKGTMTSAEGAVYEGEFKDGEWNGHGKCTWPDGDVYEGEFKDGNLNGHGKRTWPDGHVYEGEFKDGKFNGKGVEMWPEEKRENYAFKLECNYINDKAEGVGIWYYNDHTYRKCIFQDGKAVKIIEEGTWK